MVELVRFDAMKAAVAACYDVDEVHEIRSKAIALEAYYRVMRDPEPERRACEIRLRAERKYGQLLAEMEKSKGGRRGKTENCFQPGTSYSDHACRPEKSDFALARERHGIGKTEAFRLQKLAAIPEEDFEAALAAPGRPTTTGIIEAAKASPAVKPMDDRALWLWGRLRDFERDASPVLDDDPIRLINEMTDQMRADVVRLIPRVCAWLERIISA